MRQRCDKDDVSLEGALWLESGGEQRSLAFQPSHSHVGPYQRESTKLSPALRKRRDCKRSSLYARKDYPAAIGRGMFYDTLRVRKNYKN